MLIPSIGSSQNIVVAVSAPAEVENVEESIQFILNSLRLYIGLTGSRPTCSAKHPILYKDFDSQVS